MCAERGSCSVVGGGGTENGVNYTGERIVHSRFGASRQVFSHVAKLSRFSWEVSGEQLG